MCGFWNSRCGLCCVWFDVMAYGIHMCTHDNKILCYSAFVVQWLKTLPTTRQSFGTLFGECPYCNEVSVCVACRLESGNALHGT